jgi:uncharacterized protein YciI
LEFIIYSEDKPDSLHIRQSVRNDHLAWLKTKSEVELLIAGPWMDENEIMRGSLLIVKAKNKNTVTQWLKGDPYGSAGLTNKVIIRHFKWVIGK